jgi:hypothetical protein
MYRLENFAASFERSNERCVMERICSGADEKNPRTRRGFR